MYVVSYIIVNNDVLLCGIIRTPLRCGRRDDMGINLISLSNNKEKKESRFYFVVF